MTPFRSSISSVVGSTHAHLVASSGLISAVFGIDDDERVPDVMADDHQFARVEVEGIGDRVVAVGGPDQRIVLLAGFGGTNAQNRSESAGKERRNGRSEYDPAF